MAKIAYLILTHGQPYQTIDFLWSIWREEDAYFVHVDRKSPAFSAAALAAVAAAYPNVHIVPADICTWGGFTLVEAALRCLMAALRAECEWSHAVLVSGSHLPLRRAAAFAAALEPEVSYMTLHRLDLDPANQSPPGRFSGRASRFSYEYEEVRGIGAMRGQARQVPADSAFFWGSQWWILSRPAAEFVCAARHSPLAQYFRGCAIPDEGYFQTVLANSPLAAHIRNQDIVWQQWGGDGRPKVLSDPDIRAALRSDRYFARKAGAATWRDATELVAHDIATVDFTSWKASVVAAFAQFLPPAMQAMAGDSYATGGDGGQGDLAEGEMLTRCLLKEISQTIELCARQCGLNTQIATTLAAVNQAILQCGFPESHTAARYFLIVRLCRLEIAWIGLYLLPGDLDQAAVELRSCAHPQGIDFEFPPAFAFAPYHDLLEVEVRRKGVVLLDSRKAGESIAAIVREYLEILASIPGSVRG